MEANDIKYKIIEVTILSLTARKEAAENFPFNQSMQWEAKLCKAQIEALEKENIHMAELEILKLDRHCY